MEYENEYDAIDAGIEPGGLRRRSNVRLLICYIIGSINNPVKKDHIVSAMQKNAIANYFEILDAFDDLVHKKNIIPDENNSELYVLSKSGRMIAANLSDELPLTIRERTLSAVLELIAQEKNEAENLVEIEKIKNGYLVKCRVADEDVDLVSFQLYVPDSKQARLVKKNFQNNAEMIYKMMIAAVTHNADFAEQTLEDIKKSKKSI